MASLSRQGRQRGASRRAPSSRITISLARAMVGEPRLLVLDEPFGHFDPESRVAVLSARPSMVKLIKWW